MFPKNIGAVMGAAQACGVSPSRIRAVMQEAFLAINAAVPSASHRETLSKTLYESYLAMVGHYKSRGGDCEGALKLFSYAEMGLKNGAIPDSLKREFR
jgi:hypothetical protein